MFFFYSSAMLCVQREMFLKMGVPFGRQTMMILVEFENFTFSSVLTPKQNSGVYFESNAQWCSSSKRVPPLL